MLELNKIFVGGLNYETDEKKLIECFSKYGQVINVRIVRDHATGKSKGFAFVTFTTNEAAEKSKEMDSQSFDGRVIGVKIAFNKRT